MADGIFNIARGKIGYYSGLPATDYITIVVLEVSEADDTLNNYDTLSALLAGTPNEATSTNYARKQLGSGITYSVDDTANTAKSVVDSDQTWSSVSQAGSEVWVDLLMTYDPDQTNTAASMIPMTFHDFSVTPNGGDITANFDQTNGFWGSA